MVAGHTCNTHAMTSKVIDHFITEIRPPTSADRRDSDFSNWSLVLVNSCWITSSLLLDHYQMLLHFSFSCFSQSLQAILTSQPTLWYSHWIISRGHSFLCASISSRGTLPTLHLLGQGRGSLGHSSLCWPSINWCSPVSWQYWQLTLRRGHSVSTWLVRYHHSINFLHSLLQHFTFSNWQPSLLPSDCWCHVVHPATQTFLLVQYMWRLLISLSACLFRNVTNSASRRSGHALEIAAAFLKWFWQVLQKTCPQHSLR